MPQQLILNIKLSNPHATFANYVVGKNVEAINFLSRVFVNRTNSFVYLWGVAGTGKTHLLQACCHEMLQKKLTVFYLDFSQYQLLDPEILQGLEQYDLVCLDNLQVINNDKAWQESLFYFYNRSRDNKRCLLIAADKAPLEMELTLADLKSRLSWGLVLHLQALEDEDKLFMLQKHANNKGIKLSQEVSQYILNHFSRDTHQLMQLLDKIDEQSLIEKRKITVPFLKSLQGFS